MYLRVVCSLFSVCKSVLFTDTRSIRYLFRCGDGAAHRDRRKGHCGGESLHPIASVPVSGESELNSRPDPHPEECTISPLALLLQQISCSSHLHRSEQSVKTKKTKKQHLKEKATGRSDNDGDGGFVGHGAHRTNTWKKQVM